MESKTKKIALFGGSFDPVQKAHEDIVKKLSKKFDKVVVIPSFISPYKKDANPESGEHRLQMLKIAFEGIENVEVSAFETNKTEVSYTYITAGHFAVMYKDAQIYFVLGSDLLNQLHKWTQFDTIKNLVTFYIIEREGYAISDKDISRLQKKKAKIELSKITMPDMSSSMARVEVVFGKSSQTSKKVFEYIKQNNLYNQYNFIVKEYSFFKLNSKADDKTQHTFNAVKEGIKLAKKYKADVEKTIKALLLHDIAKNADDEVLKKANIKLTAKIKAMPEKIRHAEIGAIIAKKYFGINDSQIVGAIKLHTTGKAKMNKLAKIVFLADYIETGRSFVGVEAARELVKESLDLAMELALKNIIAHNKEKGNEIYPTTFEALEYFMQVNGSTAPKDKKPETKKAIKSNKEPAAQESIKAQQRVRIEQINSAYDLAYTIAQCIDDKKGRDIVLIDLSEKTIIADYFVIATVSSTTAVKAITDYVDEKLSKDYGIEPLRRDIDPKWTAVDYGSVIVHVQLDEIREFYNIERLWSDGKNVKNFN